MSVTYIQAINSPSASRKLGRKDALCVLAFFHIMILPFLSAVWAYWVAWIFGGVEKNNESRSLCMKNSMETTALEKIGFFLYSLLGPSMEKARDWYRARVSTAPQAVQAARKKKIEVYNSRNRIKNAA